MWNSQYLLAETPNDYDDCENLLDLAFGPERHVRTVNMLRKNIKPIAGLSSVYREKGTLLGMVRYYAVMTAGGALALTLGPIAVRPNIQHGGLGKFLIAQTLEMADKTAFDMVFLVGFTGYYEQFGFFNVNDHFYFNGPVAPKFVMVRTQKPEILPQHYGQLDFVNL